MATAVCTLVGVVGAGVRHPDPAQAELHLQHNPALTSLFAGEGGTVEFLTDVKPHRGS
jgi:hypothetical protein